MKEAQLYLKTRQHISSERIHFECRYQPSVYTAQVWALLHTELSEEDREALMSAIVHVLEEKMKVAFKRQLELTEERDGFLETGSLSKLSDTLARECQRVALRFKLKEVSSAID